MQVLQIVQMVLFQVGIIRHGVLLVIIQVISQVILQLQDVIFIL